MMRRIFSLAFVIPGMLFATDFAPWYGNDLEFHPRETYIFQKYCNNTNNILISGLEGSYDVYQIDAELNLSHTKARRFGFDDFHLTGRYRFLNDIVGDPVSVVAGVTLIRACHKSVKDKNTFHHGLNEAEFTASVGKEESMGDDWTSRSWALGALGTSDRGSPWARLDLVWEKNYCHRRFLRIFANSLFGFGSRNLHSRHFSGYGDIRHRSIDLGFEYKMYVIETSELTLGYSYRPYAENFPKQVNSFMIRLMYPFGP